VKNQGHGQERKRSMKLRKKSGWRRTKEVKFCNSGGGRGGGSVVARNRGPRRNIKSRCCALRTVRQKGGKSLQLNKEGIPGKGLRGFYVRREAENQNRGKVD